MGEWNEQAEREFFGKQLTYYLNLNSKTQGELAEYLGVSKQIVSAWCKGSKMPRMGKVQSIAEFLHCNNSDLIGAKSYVDERKDELFEKRKLLFSISERATEEDMDKIIKIVEMVVGDKNE